MEKETEFDFFRHILYKHRISSVKCTYIAWNFVDGIKISRGTFMSFLISRMDGERKEVMMTVIRDLL